MNTRLSIREGRKRGEGAEDWKTGRMEGWKNGGWLSFLYDVATALCCRDDVLRGITPNGAATFSCEQVDDCGDGKI